MPQNNQLPLQTIPQDKMLQDTMLHERAVLCARLARLLLAALSALNWQSLRFADRSRLARALTRLASDAHLAAQAAGGRAERAEQESTKTLPCSAK